jgi:hypothetical protein
MRGTGEEAWYHLVVGVGHVNQVSLDALDPVGLARCHQLKLHLRQSAYNIVGDRRGGQYRRQNGGPIAASTGSSTTASL